MAVIFEQILGHESNRRHWRQALAKTHLPHAHIFSGLSGVGKKFFSTGVAQALMCRKSDWACGICDDCLRVERGFHTGVKVIENPGGSIKIEDIREIADFFSLQSVGRSKVVIIDQAERLTGQAFHALLKTLEEPPADCYIFLLTSRPSAFPVTIRSRCQSTFFGPLSDADLKKITQAEPWIIRAARGQIHQVMELKNGSELRQTAFSVLKLWAQNQLRESRRQARDLVTPKESAVLTARMWQKIVRDALIEPYDADEVYFSDAIELRDILKAHSAGVLQACLSLFMQLEEQIAAGVDALLAIENALIKANFEMTTERYSPDVNVDRHPLSP